MSAWELLDEKKGELGPWLQRAVWLPLRRLLKMFHILPVVAATIVFVLLASGGQLREIYVSYLEDTGSAAFFSVQGLWVAERFVAVAAGFALISAVLYEAHYLLSTLRMSPIYSTNAELGSGSRLRHVQEMAAIALVLSPWLGLATGLLNAKFALAYQFQILSNALGPHSERRLADMQHVPMPSAWAIIIAVMVLGSVLSLLVAANPKSRTLQRAVIVATPPAAALFFLLLTDKPYFNPDRSQIVFICGVVAAVVAVYYLVYHRLYTIRALVFAPALQHSTGVNLRKYHRWLLFGWALFPWLAVLGLYFRFAPAVENDLAAWLGHHSRCNELGDLNRAFCRVFVAPLSRKTPAANVDLRSSRVAGNRRPSSILFRICRCHRRCLSCNRPARDFGAHAALHDFDFRAPGLAVATIGISGFDARRPRDCLYRTFADSH